MTTNLALRDTSFEPVSRRIDRLPPARRLADAAVWALIAEAELTPKPALVDGRGSGAHRDLSLDAMRRSAWSLHPSFQAMALAAAGRRPERSLRAELAVLGRAAEPAMMAATGGSNAHRGAIWAVGLLVAATAMNPGDRAEEIGARAGRIAFFPDRFMPAAPSHGQSAAARYGVAGARGEAQLGFPHAVGIGLPVLRQGLAAGLSPAHARLDALMAIMASLDDTCLLHRGGLAALQAGKSGAQAVLDAGGAASPAGSRALAALHDRLMTLNASPGGAADMLAAALFLDRVTKPMSVTEAFRWKS
ncbi:MAG: triphosphoribosyl-dephospho-CoA synthase [Dongiaceae bacterium]